MLNIYVISNDKRVASLIEYFQPYCKTKIRSAADFDLGLKEVFENRPSVVFIQSCIGTVSGETVARHIKSLLGTESPRIIFIGEVGQQGKQRASWCDAWIPLSDSEQQLREDFSRIIATAFPEDWPVISDEMVTATPVAVVQVSDFGKGLDAVLTPDIGEDSLDAADLVQAQPELLAEPVAAEVLDDLSTVNVSTNVTEELPFQIEEVGRQAAGEFIPGQPRRVLLGVLMGVVVIAVAVAGFFVWHRALPERQLPVDSPVPAIDARVRPAAGIRELPPFINKAWHDPAYSKQHQGWERYQSHDKDFRLFREDGVIRALQIISRSQEGISAVFLRDVLRQTGHGGPLPAGSEQRKDGFLLKSYVLSGGTELVVYQEQRGALIRAIVLAFAP
jgi:hypothetical protein